MRNGRQYPAFIRGILLIALGGLGWMQVSSEREVANAAATCTTSGPISGAYTVTVCFSTPADGSTLKGNTTITATASGSSGNPGVQRLVFYIDGNYLLTDYQSPYTFTLPTARWSDGTHSLTLEAAMRDSFVSNQTTLQVAFNNGVSTPPVNQKQWTPALGTSPAGGKPLVVAAVGDGASGEMNASNVASLIASWKPNLFLYLGDVYEKGSPTEFTNWYGGPGQAFGQFRSITDPTIGNHEYTNRLATGYYDYWDNAPDYYSIDVGNWHIISLNTNSQFNQAAPGTAQYQWLVQDLAANQASCTLAFWHQPLFNIGAEPSATYVQAIWSLLVTSEVDIALNGHDHDYQRWQPLDGSGLPDPNGMTEFVVGTGGHGMQTFVTTDSRVAQAFDSNTSPAPFGALRLELGTASASYAFINTSGTTLDAGTIPCHRAGGTSTPTPTSTATPTRTATPTQTPIPPTLTLTATPIPATPTPTATPIQDVGTLPGSHLSLPLIFAP